MNNFKDLSVWQKGIDLVKDVYLSTESFPKSEQFGLINQIRRAAVSIPSNIAEGAGRLSPREFKHFLSISLGSCFELETQILISKELDFLQQEVFVKLEKQIIEIQKMLRGLQKSLEQE